MDNDKQTKYKIAGQVSKANDDGSIKFHLITDDVDRDSEVLLPEGAILENWKSNPVWLWAHNIEAWGGLERAPIGKINTATIEQTEHFLAVDVTFDEKNDEFAKMIANKHRDGFLNATSVGFIPKVIGVDPVRPGQQGNTFMEFEVLEGSSVPIPANPAALQQNNWGSFVDGCKAHGFTNIGMRSWLKMAGWNDDEIKDALHNEQTRINIPYDKTTVSVSEKCEITDVSEGKKAEQRKLDDSETVVESDQDEKIGISIDEISKVMQILVDNGLSDDEAESAVFTAITELNKTEKLETKIDNWKIILNELNSFSKPTSTDKTLEILQQMKS